MILFPLKLEKRREERKLQLDFVVLAAKATEYLRRIRLRLTICALSRLRAGQHRLHYPKTESMFIEYCITDVMMPSWL